MIIVYYRNCSYMYVDIMNILLVLPKMREIENFDMTNPRDNEQISPVPWHFVKSRFHCMRLCTEAWVCSDLVPSPPSFPPAHVPPSPLSLIICKCIHLHLRSLCNKADIKVQKRNCTVFCFSILIILNCSFLHYCEQRYHLLAWVDNEIENTEICMKLFSWT